jgi:hypothetical protein
MSMSKPPIPYAIEYYLEEHVSSVVEATPLQITYKAYDHASALQATSVLLAKGRQARCFPVQHLNTESWHVHSNH